MALDCWNKNFIHHAIFGNIKNFIVQNKFILPDHHPDLILLNGWLQKIQPGLINLNNQKIKFVDQALSFPNFDDGYEQRIFLKGEVQTRYNWHDFFNALTWMRFPETKKQVNSLQYRDSISQHKLGKTKQRTVIQNQLAHFDECGVIVLSSSLKLLDLIKNHQWHELFWQNRDKVLEQIQFEIFGHALYEKALNPYIGFTGKAILIHADDFESFDQQAAKYIQSNLDTIQNILAPLPILGVPGWWDENKSENFYLDNKNYFR